MTEYVLAFDIGGTYIKAAALTRRGELLPGTMAIYPAESNGSREEILERLATLACQQSARLPPNAILAGIGYAFPGPFDYEEGISYMQGQCKYDRIYGVSLRPELLVRLQRLGAKLATDFRIGFANDAALFALGEALGGQAAGCRRVVCVTIGTGIGSAFLEDGQLVPSRADVPPDGWLYRLPLRDGIVEDYISARGLQRLAAEQGIVDPPGGAAQVAELARAGSAAAAVAYSRFGELLGEALQRHAADFAPEVIVLGGQLSRSSDLFADALREALPAGTAVRVSADTSRSTFAGVAGLLQRRPVDGR